MVKKLNKFASLIEFIEKNPCFVIHNNILFCNTCNEIKEYNPSEGIRSLSRHIKTKKHMESLLVEQKRLNAAVVNHDEINKFHTELLDAFISANIPLNKLENTKLKSFLENYSGRKIKSVAHYRNNEVDLLYENKLKEIKNVLHGEFVYIVFDETTDACGRYILNLLMGKCSESERSRPFLISLIELTRTNSANVNSEILTSLAKLFNNDISQYSKIKLLLSDAALYALKAGRMLKEIISDMKHITCVCHALHNLSETIRDSNVKVDTFVAFMKHSLIKNRVKQDLFFITTNLHLPKWPVITRWGTWLSCVGWLFDTSVK